MALSISDLVLPEIKGDLEVDLAVGVDPTLAGADKLPVLVGAEVTADIIFQNDINWAMLNDRVNSYPEVLKVLVYNTIAGLIKPDLIRYRSSSIGGEEFDPTIARPDGDWVRTSLTASHELSRARRPRMVGIIAIPLMQGGLLVVGSTKAH
jgi:hypothetical protein